MAVKLNGSKRHDEFMTSIPKDGRSNVDLERGARMMPGLASQFKGVYSKDELPRLGDNQCAIVNLADSDKPGTHWVATGIKHNQPWYFDSFGLGVPKNVAKQLGAHAGAIVHTPVQIQSNNSNRCGDFALAACQTVATTGHTSTPQRALQQFVSHMNIPNLENNDHTIEQKLKSASHHKSQFGMGYIAIGPTM
jgi:hypothetical protein